MCQNPIQVSPEGNAVLNTASYSSDKHRQRSGGGGGGTGMYQSAQNNCLSMHCKSVH